MYEENRQKKQGLYDPRYEHDSCGVGFVCNIDGKKTSKIINQGLQVLEHLKHRGATGSDPKTGDGAGIMIQMPHAFLKKVSAQAGIDLPDEGRYGAGLVFLPQDENDRIICEELFKSTVQSEGALFLGFRNVPVDDSFIGVTAQRSEPVMKHAFVELSELVTDEAEVERTLYVIRKKIENAVRDRNLGQSSFFYITNLSSKTLIYKGLLMPEQVRHYFLDFKDRAMTSALALVHSRYSTNTFPTWDLAQPFRFLAHNGEINTLRGNINWFSAREKQFQSDLLGNDIKKLSPIIIEGGSDSACLDNALELLYHSGRSLPHAITMLVPDAWNQLNPVTDELRAYFEYHATFMEPWDGPAALAYTNGDIIGAMLDRNGLRPARYVVTKDNFCVMASEVGVLDIKPEKVLRKGRLIPGKILVIDTKEQRIFYDDEVKTALCNKHPYKKWLAKHRITLQDLPQPKKPVPAIDSAHLPLLQKAFGYTREELKMILEPMALNSTEPTGSMGNDAPLAIFSSKALLLYNYFKQLFAQVTNPPIDSYRETLVMSLISFIGRQKNLLEPTPEHCAMLKLEHPVLTNEEFRKIRAVKLPGFSSEAIDILFDAQKEGALAQALQQINLAAEYLVKKGVTFIILSDRNVSAAQAAIPALLATASVHYHLVREGLRTQASLIVETADAREVMHFALLLGYGASAINPYLAFETIKQMHAENIFGTKIKIEPLLLNYRNAIGKGLLKVFSKMGISTVRSYCGAQIFEAVGLDQKVINAYFTNTSTRIEGASIDIIEKETLERHRDAFGSNDPLLALGGNYQSLKKGERHSWSPEAITLLQQATRTGNKELYEAFSQSVNQHDKNLFYLRGLLKFKPMTPVDLKEVESAANIVKRFVTGAMSYGSISIEAHETMAIAMNRLGGKSNSGEGGEDPNRFLRLPNGDSKRSAIKQVASGRFGVTPNYLTNADELQIKIAQGAKPGEGGQLPGHKIDEIIAKTRHSTPGVTLISPPPHHDIYSIEDLAQLIFDLKNANPRARISVKLVAEIGVGTVAAGVAKGHADMILISGHDGGTGASPLSSIKHAGIPWELGLAETQQTLVMNDLRGRTRLQTDGQMRTGRDIAIAALLGAEEYGFATAALVVLGCVMMRKCHLNTCPVGVATQDPLLRKYFKGRPEYLVNYFTFVAEELRQIMASLGFRTIDEMIGRVDVLEANAAITFWKTKNIDLSRLLYRPEVPSHVATHCVQKQDHGIDHVLDKKLIKLTKYSWTTRKQLFFNLPIKNTDRATGTMLSGKISELWGEDGLPRNTLNIKFSGSAGQSFGAFLAQGINLELVGDANDYLGKGMAGGRIVVRPPEEATFLAENNVIAGNVLFYGATGGEAYINGQVGERFCIRNSGVYAVVEGIGDHGCEYMTGGRVVVIGPVGRNFAAGMSGGIAYVYDESGNFDYLCNKQMVDLDPLDKNDEYTVHEMLHTHIELTNSAKAQALMDNFRREAKKFIKVFPKEYKRVLAAVAASTTNHE